MRAFAGTSSASTDTRAAASQVSAPYSLDSSQRISYRPMARYPKLAVPHTRFGSNVPPKTEITQRAHKPCAFN